MSEKRFELAYEQGDWWAVRDGDITLWKEEVVALLNELAEENEALKKFIKDNFNEMMDNKMVIDDEPFKFNKNCAKPYEIRSVSQNGVVRAGKKNSKVSWRMKDVREISQELPHFEDFNRETFMRMRNKFRKFDKDVLGRIIYNIYIGTFEEYI